MMPWTLGVFLGTWIVIIGGMITAPVLTLWVIGILFVNQLIGCCVMESIDTDGRKLEWFKQCPDPTGFVQMLVLELWPVFLFLWWLDERRVP